MKILFSPYVLRAKSRLSARATTLEREGALVRVEWSPSEIGFADCFAWPELGDAPLREQLESLQSAQAHPVARQTLRCARLDAEARQRGVRLWDGLQLPNSHYLITDFKNLGPSGLDRLNSLGFTTLKLKVASDIRASDLNLFLKLCRDRFRLRLDANESLEAPQAAALLSQIDDLSCIEFFEDPSPYLADTWRVLSELVPLARDRGGEASGHFQYVVHKPAIEDEIPAPTLPICVTSYMDHPLGQCFAAYQAARLAKRAQVVVCGLQTHVVYEANPFSETFGALSPRFRPPPGLGLGFDELLEKQNWKHLVP